MALRRFEVYVKDSLLTRDFRNGSAVANFNATDWAWVFGTGLVGLPIGFKTGLASGGRARIPTMYAGGIIGLMGGFCFALQNSSGRLLGLLPNEAEVEEANRRR